MAGKTQNSTARMRRICGLFMLVCIFFFILPHAHDCGGEDCPLCVLKDMFSQSFFAACLFGFLPMAVFFAGEFAYLLKQSAPQTLVHLKVKLSD